MSKIAEDLGRIIKEHRLWKNLSLGNLSKRTGIDISDLCRMEKGKQSPTPNASIKLAEALKINSETILILARSDHIIDAIVRIRSKYRKEKPI
jgi:ribosome-binding protein aMBF1 (putative translation factor)